MFGFFKELLSSDKIIEGGMSAMDKVILTKEEKLDFKFKFIQATMPMNRTRRFITLCVSPIWAFHAFLGTFLLLTANPMFSAYMAYMNTNITIPFSIIIGFYFWNERLGNSIKTTKGK